MGVRVSRTLYDAYITCQESHYQGVLDNPQRKERIILGQDGSFTEAKLLLVERGSKLTTHVSV